MRMDWTPEMERELAALVGDNKSASQIAAVLGCSRNAVIGKAHRLGLVLGRSTGRPSRHQLGEGRVSPMRQIRRAAKVRKISKSEEMRERLQASLDPVSNLLPEMTMGGAVSFLEAVERDRCLHYVGDPHGNGGPDMPVCGAGRTRHGRPGTRYCARHELGQWQARALA